MAGTKIGGVKAAQKNKERDPDFYKKIGRKGGSVATDLPKGFAYSAANGYDWHKEAGRRGGTISRKRKAL
jgi:general stress protein YciG